ncbi:MAG: tyrosine-protein phosphatase [Paraclostridium bifermentans]|uniref:tyrosine-protein phosphatase n=1 Tax=Paraclostridium bifermentans TaxID=1490 RepID=UPI001E172D20|nr:tyrosine-protein phosphatase [Paraclostridium bifermentans]MBS6508660.1 tyrosine-protein phosphatase [Paraclostridium bifermentans]MDU3803955.1 tyrosine-protein phosphatase [Paraclostridium bifermentans]
MINFRDIGGCKSSDGRVVKEGLFFRSANLVNLSKNDLQMLKDLNIKTIFDFRDESERLSSPSDIVENINYIRIPAMPQLKSNIAQLGSIKEMMENMFDKNNAFELLKEAYYNLPVNNPAYKELVKLMQNDSSLPILMHCTAGKDRTGVGSAIILMILGVNRSSIVEDYLKSNQSAKDSINEILSVQPELKNVPKDKLKYIFGVNETYIDEVFKRIDTDFESTEDYLLKEFNLTKDDIKNLQSKYLY